MRIRSALLLCSFIFGVSGCAGQPEITPQVSGQDAALNREVKDLQKQQDLFATDAAVLIQEVQAFRRQQGWDELAPILKRDRSGLQESTALKAWSEKWKQPADSVSLQFHTLAERSTAIEKRRKELIAKWGDMKKKEDMAIRNSGRYDAKSVDSIVANSTLIYELNKVSLNRVGLDELGLFGHLER
jgi:hypothetical protein